MGPGILLGVLEGETPSKARAAPNFLMLRPPVLTWHVKWSCPMKLISKWPVELKQFVESQLPPPPSNFNKSRGDEEKKGHWVKPHYLFTELRQFSTRILPNLRRVPRVPLRNLPVCSRIPLEARVGWGNPPALPRPLHFRSGQPAKGAGALNFHCVGPPLPTPRSTLP